ncbi:MAG: hypothetical protein KDE55_05135 [Novosphingobium sp.]|nr:hypothetical protein [Novosphingobium sp.]
MLSAILALAASGLVPAAYPAKSSKIDDDMHCMAAFLIHEASEEQNGTLTREDKENLHSFVFYYLGSIQAQNVNYDVGRAIGRLLEDPRYVGAGYLVDLERCSTEIGRNVEVLNRIPG